MPVLAEDEESENPAGKCDGQEMSPHSGDLQEERGLEPRGQNEGLEKLPKLQLPAISQTCHISPFLSPVCADVRTSHRLPLGRKQDRNWESGGALVLLLLELGFDWINLAIPPQCLGCSALPQWSLALRDTS